MTTSTLPHTLPHVPGLPLLGNLIDIGRQGVFDFYLKQWQTYGRQAFMKFGPMPVFMFTSAEAIQTVLIKNPDIYVKGISHYKLRQAIGNGILTLEGEKWRSQRRLMQPTYTPLAVQQFAEIMQDEAQQTLVRWDKHFADFAVIDVGADMARTTVSIISRAMFGTDMGTNASELAQGFHYLVDYVAKTTTAVLDIPAFIPTRRNRQYNQAKASIRRFMFDIITKRRTEGLQDDLLSILMSSRDEETGESMSDDQLHDEALITIFAGHETTASLMTWTWYYLAHYPAIEKRLHDELETVLNGRRPTVQDLPQLTYMRMILDEVLRLRSPVMMVARDVTQDHAIEGHAIPAGAMIVPFIYGTHRDSEYWEKPDEFYPEHFAPEQVEQRPRYAYAPFGAGHRICIGNHFALMEASLVLAELAQHYRLEMAEPHNGAFRWLGTIQPNTPIKMSLVKR